MLVCDARFSWIKEQLWGLQPGGGVRAPHLREAETQPRPAISLSVSLSLGLCLSPCPSLCSAHPWSPCLCRLLPASHLRLACGLPGGGS